MVYLAREKPHPVEEGKPKRPDPVKATRSPVPCYFRYLQHISWVLACISSMIVMSVFWLAIVSSSLCLQATCIGVCIRASADLDFRMHADVFLAAVVALFGAAVLGVASTKICEVREKNPTFK